MTDALFIVRGDRATPTPWARGPWDPGALHGGPVAALMARSVERADAGGVRFAVARFTLELLRPVPLEELAVHGHVVRPGRKVQLVETTLSVASSGLEVARARALRIREGDVVLPYDDPALAEHLEPEPAPPPPSEGRVEGSTLGADGEGGGVAFHSHGAEHRFVAGSWAEAGPVTVWIRLCVAVVAGEEPSPLQRTLAAADFGNGVSRVLPFETHLFINPDLTVHLLREPRGEWIGMATRTHLGEQGYGLAESALYDEHGRVGRSVQSLLVEAR